jgi:hypothetical protein
MFAERVNRLRERFDAAGIAVAFITDDFEPLTWLSKDLGDVILDR